LKEKVAFTNQKREEKSEKWEIENTN